MLTIKHLNGTSTYDVQSKNVLYSYIPDKSIIGQCNFFQFSLHVLTLSLI